MSLIRCSLKSIDSNIYLLCNKYCLAYVLCLQASINIIFDRVGKTDPITKTIEIAVNYLGIQFDVSLFIHL